MAPRKRKVVVAPANSPEKVKYSTAVIQTVLSAQQSETTHAKLVKQLKQLYSTVQHDSFMKSFVQVIKRQMEHEETNPYANNVLKFCAKFVADPEYSEQAVTHPIMASIFDWLLSTISSAQLVRFRICQLVNLILNALGSDAALDDTVCDKILRYMLERIRDVSQHVRVQAVLALQRLQDPNSPEDPVVRAYVYHLDKDPSPKVRQTIISALGRNYRLIPYVLERLWDVDERVRRHTYMQMSSYPVRHYKVEQRLKFLEQGLTDHSDGVRKVMRNVMIPQWIESYQRDYVGFVEALKLDADDKEMERFRKTSKLVLMEIFKKNGVKHMAQLLNFGEESKTVPLSELTIERAICWQAMLEHLQQSDSDEQEDYMIELSKFCEYIKALVENPNALAFMKANANVTASAIGSNQVAAAVAASSPSQPETMDKLQQLYLQYILQILLEIVLMYDFGDEFGRDSLKQVLSHMLCQETLFEMNVRLIMETFEKIITDVESRLTFFVELVSSVLEPSRQDVSISSRQLIDTYLEKHPELTTLKIQISALRVKILELKEQESALSAQRDYAGAQRMNDELNMCNEKYANLVKPLIHEMSLTCASGSSIGAQIREQIKRWIDEDCSTSLEKITYRILEQFQVRVCRSTVAKEVGDFNYSLKRLHLHGDQKHEGDIVAARQEYANALSAMSANVPDNSVVFIGEEAFKISVRVMRAKPCSGNRAFKIMPEIRIRNVTVLCAMNRFGILHYLTRNRAIDRSVFSAFIDELIVKLRLINIPRAVIIMDDVPTHTSVETKSLFEQGPDELMYLPLQSSFLNPIETLFSSWKQICNRANPNSEEEVIAAIENGQDLITPTDSEGCFQLMWSHVMFETIQN